jgi:prophage antirepressor-like protein
MLILGFAALLATGSAFADTQSTAPVIHDKTGFFVHMDVAKVLDSTDISQQCGLIPARLDYLDHQGREHVLDYQVNGTGCTNDH